ncbi:MAG: hypothetical protein Q8P12_06420 [bacterium]|nr:hypothetical protein [bacterium]
MWRSTANAGRWFWKRYGWAEIAGKITTVAAALGVSVVMKSGVITVDAFSAGALIALAGTLGENLGYYGVHTWNTYHFYAREDSENIWSRTGRSLIMEFGPSEIYDSFLVRPGLMGLFPALLGNVGVGILLGSLAADVIFYGWPPFARKLFPQYVRGE